MIGNWQLPAQEVKYEEILDRKGALAFVADLGEEAEKCGVLDDAVEGSSYWRAPPGGSHSGSVVFLISARGEKANDKDTLAEPVSSLTRGEGGTAQAAVGLNLVWFSGPFQRGMPQPGIVVWVGFLETCRPAGAGKFFLDVVSINTALRWSWGVCVWARGGLRLMADSR